MRNARWQRALVLLSSFFCFSISIGQLAFAKSKSLKEFSSNVPLVSITTEGKKKLKRKFKRRGTFSFVDHEGESQNHTGELESAKAYPISVRHRGQSSLIFKKKQYQIYNYDPEDPREDLKIGLFGMSESDKWIFNAPYVDKTLIRNALVYRWARALRTTEGKNWYAPRSRFVELFFNGDYRGVYLAIERIERDKERVDLKKVDKKNPKNSEFLLRVDVVDKKEDRYFKSRNGIFYTHRYPSKNKIIKYEAKDLKFTQELLAGIERRTNDFELALESPDFKDPKKGYRAYIDVRSFINYMLIQEVSKNIDGYRRSVYVHYKDGRIHLGPVWDFNLAFGNVWFYKDRRFHNQRDPEGWQHRRVYVDGNNEIFWIKRLIQDKDFVREFIAEYYHHRGPGGIFSDEKIDEQIDLLVTELGEASTRNFKKWKHLGRPVWPIIFTPPPWPKTYEGEIKHLKKWIKKRLFWIDQNINDLIRESNWVKFKGRLKGAQR